MKCKNCNKDIEIGGYIEKDNPYYIHIHNGMRFCSIYYIGLKQKTTAIPKYL